MYTSTLRSQLCFQNHTHLTTPSAKANPHFLIPIKTTSPYLKHSINPSPITLPPLNPTLPIRGSKHNHIQNPLILKLKEGISHVSPDGYSRVVVVGAVTIGLVLFLIGVDEQKALALGPEGPLMEEFWDNMRRYGLYVLSVSTGVAWAIFQPIWELLKNPISAILVITIFGGSIFIVSQVLSAMVGVSEFNYQYSY